MPRLPPRFRKIGIYTLDNLWIWDVMMKKVLDAFALHLNPPPIYARLKTGMG